MLKDKKHKWEEIISEFKTSGKTQVEWCRENNINLRRFNYWFCKFKKNIEPQIELTNWISVIPKNSKNISNISVINIKLGNATIEINSDFDVDHFLKIVKVLNSLC